jgi:membrane protein implicated in regulation of membrane protease activity
VSTNDTVPTNKSGPDPALPLVTPARVIAAICVIVPFVAVLWVPLYDKATPEAGGIPFFFWWQLVWVAITAALMGLAYYVVRREELAHRRSLAPAPSSAGGTAADAGAGASAGATDVDADGAQGTAGGAEDEEAGE